MASFYEILEGEVQWVRHTTPEEYLGKSSWKFTLRPTQDSLMKIMDLQSKGVKNQLKKDDKGYYINFSRPTERRNKAGAVTQRFDPPKVFEADGTTPITEMIGNGSKGKARIELYEHNTPNGGKAHAARWDSMVITDLVKYESPNTQGTAEASGWAVT